MAELLNRDEERGRVGTRVCFPQLSTGTFGRGGVYSGTVGVGTLFLIPGLGFEYFWFTF